MQTFRNFVKSKFDSRPRLKEYYGSFDRYFKHYCDNNGLSDYLETLRGTTLPLAITNSLAKVYVEQCRRYPSEIHSILVSLARQYDVELPFIEGILTADYWIEKVKQAGWSVPIEAKAKLFEDVA
jgi:hypothetical protein